LSHNLAYWDGRKLGEAEVPVVSFARYTSLSEQEQLCEAKTFYAAVMAQQTVYGLLPQVESER
ncbi:MAG TPA: hypothetical protein VFX76_00240, partial [Roseiflexaceae bacterium]|nr:hypothetical protein [Roseiflexaceae bacterium]